MSRLAGWWLRLKHLVLRREEQDLDEELVFHLDRMTEEYIASGMPPAEARRQAKVAFGGIEKSRQQCRETRPGVWIDRLTQDMRYALRGFRRNPLFTLTILATLTIGIGATTAVFSVVDRILFRPLPYVHGDRIVSTGMVHSLETQAFLMGNAFYEWRDHQKPFEAFTSTSTGARECDLTERNPLQLHCDAVEGNFLSTFGVVPVAGRDFLPEEARLGGPQVALISYRFWLTRYNLSPAILNKTIEVDGNPVRVVGVLPKEFEMPRLEDVDVIRPLVIDEVADHKANGGYGTPRRVFARLRPGITVERARSELAPLFHSALEPIPVSIRKDIHLSVRLLRDVQMQNVRLMGWVLFWSVIAVLMIACANIAGLLVARSATRQRELAVRVALGASRGRLFRQALTESLLLSFAGAMTGCLFAMGLLRVLIALAPPGIPYMDQAGLDLRVIGFTILVSLLCAVATGSVSALIQPHAELLAGRTETSVSRAFIRQWLVAGQIAASVVLLAIAILLGRSFRNLESQQTGMQTENVVTASITLGQRDYPTRERGFQFFDGLKTRLAFGPGVNAVAITDSLPPAGGSGGSRMDEIVVAGRPPMVKGTGKVATSRWISPGYFEVLNIPIVRGRDFNEEDVTSSDHPLILSHALAAFLFPNGNALGQRIKLDDITPNNPWRTVVGIAADVKNDGLAGEEKPEYYKLRRNHSDGWDASGFWLRTGILVVRSSAPNAVIAPWIRTQVAEVAPALPVDIATMETRVSKLAGQPRFQSMVVGFFAVAGLAMAVIGLYGVLAFLVAQREREIGVRMALGASRQEILRLVMGRSLRMIVCGLVVGLVLALMASRALSHMLFHVGPWDPATYLTTIALLVAVGLLATWLPARVACHVDPAVALRAE
ncbi:ABC transporter permease [Edaphobacter sp. 12200R-103]|uniref:ABC transporter permease n=1 Tax=Edaphobacter sp. 12200R-103 TaxID=2703788 RepID=UPI00138B4661|nr:ABC transporter permease [Edaphobacter sp. 12200R-103]QHS52824.1 ABC transporter permease [Edaphobacter sp. 12200R-103]